MAQPSPFPLLTRSPSSTLLIAYRLSQRPVLLIGGGLVAASRLSAIVSADATVTLVCPSSGLCDEVRQRIEVDKCVAEWIDSDFNPDDPDMVKNLFEDRQWEMVLTAIDNEGDLGEGQVTTSERIYRLCKARGISVNVADVPPLCSFYFGSVVRRGPLQILVSTGGKGPRLAHHIRRRIEDSLPEDVASAIEGVGKLRGELRAEEPGSGSSSVRARMEWMTSLCDRWTLEELSELNGDDLLRREVLRGFNLDPIQRSVPSYPHATAAVPVSSQLHRHINNCLDPDTLVPRLGWLMTGVVLGWWALRTRGSS